MAGNFSPRTTLEFLTSRLNSTLKEILEASWGSAPVARTPSMVLVTSASGLTNAGVQGVSLLVDSTDATIDGVAVLDTFSVSYNAKGSDTVDSISYNAGTGRILISYLS
jgi:hypothetical protein